MAIKISKGTLPQAGRITMPQGTFLSNPSTAADGSLGGPNGMNPPVPQVPQVNMWAGVTPGYNSLQIPIVGQIDPNPFARYQRSENIFQMTDRLAPVPKFPGAAGQEQNAAANLINSIFSPKKPENYSSFASTVSNSTQYADMPSLGDNPGAIPINVAFQAGAQDGMSPQQVVQQMQAAGYVQKWVQDVGQVWVPTGQPQQVSQFNGANGRPSFVDGASLAPGQEMVDERGNRYVGGTPAPDGTPQYAVNYANPAAARDTKGKYKWISDVRKDASGNWVRVNRQVLRKVYTRSHMKSKYAQAETGSAPIPGQGGADGSGGADYAQLVNFRANYG